FQFPSTRFQSIFSSVPFDHAGAPLIQQDLHRSLVRQGKQSFRRWWGGLPALNGISEQDLYAVSP
ncbi:MAG: hypothetical protein WB686_27995, partial [Pseudolabrys sp.]